MNLRITLFLFLLFFACNDTVFSQEVVFVTIMPLKPVAVAKGQEAQLSVRVKIKKGFHIQSNPAADEFFIPVTLTVKAVEGIVPGEPVYPLATRYRLKGSKEDLLTYEDEVVIRVPVKVLGSAPSGNANLTGTLNFQPCDDRRCFSPRSVPVAIPVEIVDLKK